MLLHVFTGNITLLVGCSEYPSRWLKSYAIFIMVCISCGLLPVSAISSAQVGAQHLMDPIFVPTPAQSKISSK
jgi:hypothetical protein